MSQTTEHIAKRKEFVRFAQSAPIRDGFQDYGEQGIFCPKCNHKGYRVIETRACGDAIRRRRECLGCQHRFTTFERLHNPEIERKLARLQYLEIQLEKLKAIVQQIGVNQ